MTRSYFAETSTLLGLTYFSDRWFRDVKPLHDRGHPLHTSTLALNEYCHHDRSTSLPPDDPSDLDNGWEGEAGKFRIIENRLKRTLPKFLRHIRKEGRNGLDLETAITAFLDHFGIRPQAESQIRAQFNEHFEERAVTTQYVGEFVHTLLDRILDVAQKNKRTLSETVTVHDSLYHTVDETRRRWRELPDDPPHEPDLSILTDATELSKQGVLRYFVTGDSDLLAVQPVAIDYYGLSIISMGDEFAPAK
jgi:hypothetical protein